LPVALVVEFLTHLTFSQEQHPATGSKTLVCFSLVNPRTFSAHKFVVDKSVELLQTWSTPIITLPDVLRLITHISMPLSDGEKVPLSNYEYDRLTWTIWQPLTLCTNDDLQKLFRRSEGEKAENLMHVLIPAVFRDAPEYSTEASYISFWDDNIRNILRAVITQGPGANKNHPR
jgi:hypothetical protein